MNLTRELSQENIHPPTQVDSTKIINDVLTNLARDSVLTQHAASRQSLLSRLRQS